VPLWLVRVGKTTRAAPVRRAISRAMGSVMGGVRGFGHVLQGVSHGGWVEEVDLGRLREAGSEQFGEVVEGAFGRFGSGLG
jgi:hypothetical protein